MFPPSDPAVMRAKLEALCPPGSSLRVHFSYPPLIHHRVNQVPRVTQIPLYDAHGNIALDDQGVLVSMEQPTHSFQNNPAVPVPILLPGAPFEGTSFSGGLKLRIPYSAVVDAWRDALPEPLVNLWLRQIPVMTQKGWMLAPLLWPPTMASRP